MNDLMDGKIKNDTLRGKRQRRRDRPVESDVASGDAPTGH